VENYQLTQTELCEELSDKEEEPKMEAVSIKQEASMTYTIRETDINQQLLDIEIKPCFEEIESDEELGNL
jgi:hypothetical protein